MDSRDFIAVKAEIKKQETLKFTGMIKIGVDMNKFTQLGISNNYQGVYEKCNQQDVEKALEQANSGSFIIEFQKGVITAYSYALTYKAATLTKRIQENV